MRSLSELDDPRSPSASPELLARVVTTARRRRRRRRIARIATASGGAAFAVVAAVVLLRADDPSPRVSVPAPAASVPGEVDGDDDWSAEMIDPPPDTPGRQSCVRLIVESVSHEACMDARGAESPVYWRVEGRDFVAYPDLDNLTTYSELQSLPLTVETAETYLQKYDTPVGYTCGLTPDDARTVIREVGDALEVEYGRNPPPIMLTRCNALPDGAVPFGLLQTPQADPDATQSAVSFQRNGDHLEVMEPLIPIDLAQSAYGTLSIPVVAGWQVVDGSPYIGIALTSPPLSVPVEYATVATFPITASPSFKCDLPVSLLDAMGPTDGFISVREVTSFRPSALPGGFGNNARPPLDDFVPTPLSGQRPDGRCVAQPENGTLLRGAFFTENGRFINVYVALGRDADPKLVEDVKSTLAQLEIRSCADRDSITPGSCQ